MEAGIKSEVPNNTHTQESASVALVPFKGSLPCVLAKGLAEPLKL